MLSFILNNNHSSVFSLYGLACCGGRLVYLNSWSPLGGTLWEGLDGFVGGDVSLGGRLWGFKKPTPFPMCSLFPDCVSGCKLHACLRPCPHCDGHSLCWLVLCVHSTQARAIREEGVSSEEKPPWDPAARHFFQLVLNGGGLTVSEG